MRLGIEMTTFNESHGGGKEQAVFNLIDGLIANGHEKEIVCICFQKRAELLTQKYPSLLIRVIDFNNAGRIKRHILWPKEIKRIIKEENIDALYFSNKMTPAVIFPIKTIVITHDIQIFLKENYFCCTRMQKTKMMLRIIIDTILRTKIFAISEYDKSEILKHMPYARKKVKVVKNGIKFSNIETENACNKYITALNIQWPHKNVFTLVKAFCKIAESVPLDLVCIGKTPDNISEIEEYIHIKELDDRIHFTGFISQEQLDEYIKQTRLYVNPSKFEGFGMTAVEMMGCGIPTLVADNSAQKEITLGLGRYYSPADDESALAEEILNEINNPKSSAELLTIAELVRSIYDYRVVAKEYWELFGEY